MYYSYDSTQEIGFDFVRRSCLSNLWQKYKHDSYVHIDRMYIIRIYHIFVCNFEHCILLKFYSFSDFWYIRFAAVRYFKDSKVTFGRGYFRTNSVIFSHVEILLFIVNIIPFILYLMPLFLPLFPFYQTKSYF